MHTQISKERECLVDEGLTMMTIGSGNVYPKRLHHTFSVLFFFE